MSTISRRTVMQQAAFAAAGLAVLPDFGWLAGAQEAGRDLVPFEDYPDNFSLKRPGNFTLPGQDVAGIDLRQVTPKIPADKTFVVTHYNVPEINAANWQLQVTGMAGRPLTFNLDDLRKRARVDRTVTFECGGNRPEVMHRMVGNATWTGCALKDVLEEARPAKEVLEAIFWAEDAGEETIRNSKYTMNFARSMALEDAMDAGAILAYEVDGQPLPIIHGYPVRMIVPGWYGVSNVKWLRRIELSPRRFMGRFMGRDYVTIMGRQVGDKVEYTETSVTRIQVKSMVAKVLRPATPGGRLTVLGVAYGDGTPIERVEVQVDGGAWKLAKLEPNKNSYSWTFWSLDIDPLSAGSHAVASRAFDRAGRTQPPDLSMKKSNWENNAVWTRKIRV